MEPTGIEPVTSCLQSEHGGPGESPDSLVFTGIAASEGSRSILPD